MALRKALQISRYLSNSTAKAQNGAMYLAKSRKDELDGRRNYASKPSKNSTEPQPRVDSCPNQTCKKEKKRSLWKKLFGAKDGQKPPIASCKVKQNECKTDPDLSHLEGKAFRTCGSAYIIQKDMLPSENCEVSAETNILKQIEASFGHKETAVDPVPYFTTVEQRMMDLDRNKLHPFYRRYHNVPKKRKLDPEREKRPSKHFFDPHYVPVQLAINHDLLEMKNIIVSYKRMEPPRQLDGVPPKSKKADKRRSRLPVIPTDSQEMPKKTNVFDTLYQKNITV